MSRLVTAAATSSIHDPIHQHERHMEAAIPHLHRISITDTSSRSPPASHMTHSPISSDYGKQHKSRRSHGSISNVAPYQQSTQKHEKQAARLSLHQDVNMKSSPTSTRHGEISPQPQPHMTMNMSIQPSHVIQPPMHHNRHDSHGIPYGHNQRNGHVRTQQHPRRNSFHAATSTTTGRKSGTGEHINGRRRSITEALETDPHRLTQRQKQIDLGKNTLAYDAYITAVPIEKRDIELRYSKHPITPDRLIKCSKRSWDGRVRQWRRLLHIWDPEGGKLEDKDLGVSEIEENAASKSGDGDEWDDEGQNVGWVDTLLQTPSHKKGAVSVPSGVGITVTSTGPASTSVPAARRRFSLSGQPLATHAPYKQGYPNVKPTSISTNSIITSPVMTSSSSTSTTSTTPGFPRASLNPSAAPFKSNTPTPPLNDTMLTSPIATTPVAATSTIVPPPRTISPLPPAASASAAAAASATAPPVTVSLSLTPPAVATSDPVAPTRSHSGPIPSAISSPNNRLPIAPPTRRISTSVTATMLQQPALLPSASLSTLSTIADDDDPTIEAYIQQQQQQWLGGSSSPTTIQLRGSRVITKSGTASRLHPSSIDEMDILSGADLGLTSVTYLDVDSSEAVERELLAAARAAALAEVDATLDAENNNQGLSLQEEALRLAAAMDQQ